MITRRSNRVGQLLALAMLAAGLGQAVHAQQLIDPRYQHGRDEVHAGGMSLDAAVATVQNRFRAKAVKTETVNERGRTVYYIRLLNGEGRVWTVRVDAETGAVN